MSEHQLADLRVEIRINDRTPGGQLVMTDGPQILLDTVPDARGLASFILRRIDGVPDEGTVHFTSTDGGTQRSFTGSARLAHGLALALIDQANFVDPPHQG